MPLYMCSCVRGTLSDPAKAKIAADITKAHCDITGAPQAFVHVFFFEDAPRFPINGKGVFVFGCIQAGQPAAQRTDLETRIKASVVAHGGLCVNEIVATTSDIPAGWVMEGGERPDSRQT